MAAISTYLAVAAVIIGGASYYSAEQNRKEAQMNYANQAEEQRKAKAEQAAMNAQAAAAERRQQVREERIKRARILQASENSGSTDSSGMFGAASGLASQLGAAIGTNLGTEAGTNRLNQFMQTAADFGTAASRNLNSAQAAQNLFGLSTTVFNAAGGFGAFKSTTPAPKTT